MKLVSLVFLSCSLSSTAQNSSYTVRPIIGSGSRGDNGPAVAALLDGPFGLAEDSQGNIYISDSNAGVIRRVRPDDVIERFAGTGTIANGAEGQAALNTDLIHPTVLTIDRDGGLIFVDSGACRIRKVQTDGTIRNVVGTGRCGGTSGGPIGTRDGRALEIDLTSVSGMVIDGAGRLVFSDDAGHVLRRLDSDGMVRTIAGSGSAGFGGDDGQATLASFKAPRGLAYDSAGNLYIADGSNCRVRRIQTDGIVKTVAGTSTCATPATSFVAGSATRSIGTLTALAYEPDTNSLLIASPGMGRVLRLDIANSRLSSVLGNGKTGASSATVPGDRSIDKPTAIVASSRVGILVADSTSFQVLQVQNGTVARFAGDWPQLDSYPAASSARLLRPKGLCINTAGSLLVVDAGAERVLTFQSPEYLTPFAGARYPTGYSSGDAGPAIAAQINDPDRVACAPNGEVYLSHGNRIRAINAQGVIRTVLSTVRIDNTASSLSDPAGIAIDTDGRIWFSEAGRNRVIRYDPGTQTSTLIAGTTDSAGFDGDGGSATEALLNSPGDLALDSQGNLLIADRGNRRIRRVSPAGTIETIAGSDRAFWHIDTSGQLGTDVGLDRIDGMTVDSRDNIYISEPLRISVIDTERRIHILTGYVGEDDAGVATYIDGPLNGCDGLAIDARGRLYFSVRGEGRVKVAAPAGEPPIDPAGPPSILPDGVVSSSAFGISAAIAPGSWIEIYGSNLASISRSWAAGDFSGSKAPISLDGTKVTIGGQDAFVAYISPSQVNAQVPSSIASGSQQLTVTTPAGTSAPHPIVVNATQPGLFAPPSLKVGDKQYLGGFFSDASYVLPTGAISGVASRSARRGEIITLYGVGFGPVIPTISAGEIVQQANALEMPLQIFFGGVPATTTYAGLAPGAIGLYQFNVVVPSVSASDAVPLTFSLGGVAGGQTLYTAVQN